MMGGEESLPDGPGAGDDGALESTVRDVGEMGSKGRKTFDCYTVF